MGDFNRNGKLDVAAGSVYYAAPDWKMVPIEQTPREYDPKGYSNAFCNFAADLNGNGWTDVIAVDFPGKQTWWFENPKVAGRPWKRHVVTPVTNNESPLYVDFNGDGKLALVCGVNPDPDNPDGPEKRMAIVRPDPADPTLPWKIQTISAKGAPGTNRYSHGLGVGDINGDGRSDILVPQGWWEQPAQPQAEWTFHPAPFGPDCAHMLVYDFDGDGDADVVTSSAHRYGIWWHEQTPDGWKTHVIDDTFSQTHAIVLADINGDGLPDLVTGKRWWAHAKGDPGGDEPAVLYWFELQRVDGRPVWKRHLIDDDSGVGTQFEVIDLNGNGLLDIVTSNKKGVHVFLQQRE